MLKQKKQRTITVSFFVVCIIGFSILFVASHYSKYKGENTGGEDTVTATVIEVIDSKVDSLMEGYESIEIRFLAKVTSGAHKGEEIEMIQTINEMYLPVPEAVEKGDKILTSLTLMGENAEWMYYGVNRIGEMILMIAVFLLLIIIIGRGKGIATIASLLLTIGAIFYVYIPSILLGRNVYIITIIVAVYIVLASLILLNGFNKKTLCAMVGNVGGTLLAGLLALIFNNILGITGIIDQDYVFLMLLDSDVAIDLKAVVWGGILIGSLGAIMDVAMSISSAMHELSQEMEKKSFSRMVRSGMTIGRDAIGTMTNTLILAYVGGSLAVVLLFTAYSRNALAVWNLEMIVVEVVQAIVGSMGILIAVPLTVFFSAAVYMKSSPTKASYTNSDVLIETKSNEIDK